jgi:5,10-methylenetetrahydrofolate reductase
LKRFRSALQEGRLVVLAELAPPAPGALGAWLDCAISLTDRVDGIVIGPAGPATVSTLALAPLLLREGVDPVPRVDCRDRNRIALHSDLLGLRANGVSSLLFEQGSPDAGGGKPVFDMSRDELIALAHSMNEDLPGAAEQDFLVGIVSAIEENSLAPAATAGAQFLVTGPIENTAAFARSMERLVAERLTWQFAVIATAPAGEDRERWRQAIESIPGVSGINLKVNHDD